MEQNSLNFLRDSFVHHRSLRSSLDQKSSFLVGVSGIIFGLSVGHLDKIHFLVLAIISFLTVLLSISATFLPFRKNIKQKFGSMCWMGFSDKSFDEYKEELNKVFASDEKIAHEYMQEIYSLANYSIKLKIKLLKWASMILILGLLAGFILFFV